jgi:hypothetical protein
MRQVLDVFDMIEDMPGVQWNLISASTNSPLQIEAEAVSFEASVDVTMVARGQKQKLARQLRELAHGQLPDDARFNAPAAKRLLTRNLNGIGATEIDLEIGEPIAVTPLVARIAIQVFEKAPVGLFDTPVAREEIGSIEGTLSDVGTHYNYPAAKLVDGRGKEIWCRLSSELQEVLQDKATYKDVWQHRRVIARGRVRYGKDGEILYILANDIRRIDSRDVPLEELKDPHFTGGLPIVEYLDRFRDGTLG